ncbi:hypothetical protein F511_14622 [Dorcoceras hygrometricum]|uniref:Uncharacterized protein n=1 Tax=Dorcoceras hygrometricum TaxID=472368 RepID=A0A2Z7A5F1_9LAMI|nr:hypothetical protein F511_14622 [Dorcoceras hygrometricum]
MGPISNIGPKTSCATRERPEKNLEAKFSHRNDAGESSDGGRTAAVATNIACGAWPHAAAPSAEPSSKLRPRVAHPVAPLRSSRPHATLRIAGPIQAHVRAPQFDHRANMCARPAAFGRPPCAASAHGSSWLRNQCTGNGVRQLHEAAPSERQPCAASAHVPRAHRWGAAMRGGATAVPGQKVLFDLKNRDIRYNMAAIALIRSEPWLCYHCWGTVADPDPVSRRGSGRTKIRPGNVQ